MVLTVALVDIVRYPVSKLLPEEGLSIDVPIFGGEFHVPLLDVLHHPVARLMPESGFLNRLLVFDSDPAYPLLSAIDEYGETAFNYLQMDQLLPELQSLDTSGLSRGEQAQFQELIRLAERCKGERCLLWFDGD